MPQKKSLLIVSNYFTPYISGMTEYIATMAAFWQKDYNVTILTGAHQKDLLAEEMWGEVRIIRAKPLFFLHKGYLSWDFVRKFYQLARQAEIINLHLPMLESGLLAYLAPSKAQLVVTYHTDLAWVGGMLDWLAVKITRASGYYALKRAQHIVVTSLDYARGSSALKKFSSKWIEIFPLHKFSGVKGMLRESTAQKVGFVGRFVQEKGLDILLKAIPLVQQYHPHVEFHLVGNTQDVAGGSVLSKLAQLLKKTQRVVLRGALTENALIEFYHEIDLLVLPSVNAYEAFGLVQLEAMHFGIPVVASNLRGVRVPIQLTANGQLCEPGNVEDLAEKIISELQTRRSKQHVFQTASEFFSHHRALEQYEKIFS